MSGLSVWVVVLNCECYFPFNLFCFGFGRVFCFILLGGGWFSCRLVVLVRWVVVVSRWLFVVCFWWVVFFGC